MQSGNDNAKRRSSPSMAGVESSRPERGDSGISEEDSETAHPKQNDTLAYRSPTSATAAATSRSQNAGSHLDQMLIPCCQLFHTPVRDLLQNAAPAPPVTRSTLMELDLNWIMHNPSLRVDINYDHDLHFMPIQGPGGEQKRQDAKKYWLALSTEFRIYQHNLTECLSCHQTVRHTRMMFKPRLRTMFDTLRELLENLVPDRDHPQIAENLDTPLLMQQVEKGVLDIVRLSQWIADLLKSHCAPMRDEWADKMAFKIEEGCANSDMEQIVDGLEELFSFLEAMKLDVANHQIRTFRFPLIEDTISFQQGYFSRKIQDKKIRPETSRKWYRTARNHHQKCRSSTEQGPMFEPLGALVHGILQQCTQRDEISKLPDTLAYDQPRIRQLREDVQDLIYLDICVQVFNHFIRQHSGDKSVSPKTYVTLQWRITTIIEKTSESRDESWPENVAIEITRAAYVECGFEYNPTHDDFEWTMRKLESALTDEFNSLAHEHHAKLEEMAFKHAKVFQDRSPLQISEAQRHWQQVRQERRLWRADAEDVARRVAHIAVLHWKVWAGLVYLGDEEENTAEGECMSQDEDGLSALDQILFESSRDSTIEPDWTPLVDQTSAVDERSGDPG